LEHEASPKTRLDLNRADHVQLMQLPGVGEAMATRIEEYRDEHHGFHSVDELRNVHGIGPLVLEKLRPHVYVELSDDEEETEPREEPRRPVTTTKPKADKPATKKKSDELDRLIDVNSASAEELQRLPGIGPTLAARIIQTREKASFKRVDDLRHVSGIGAKTLERLRPLVTVGETVAEKKD
jgi:competence protein ComEA